MDEDNNVVGQAPRSVVNINKLWHRASYVFIYNRDKKSFIVQKRTITKSYCPGYFDLTTGGVMSIDDEDEEMNARREV